MMEGTTELRKLPPGAVFGLVRILECGGAWKQLMAIIPQNGTESSNSLTPKYKGEHIKLIEQAGDKQRRPCAEILLEEWGTSGRRRPNLTLLAQLLGKAQLFRAADYVTDLLKVPPLERPSSGPAAPVDVSEEAIEKLMVRLPPELPKTRNNEIHYNTDEINRAFNEMTVTDSSLLSLNEIPLQAEVNGSVRNVGVMMQDRLVVPFVEEQTVREYSRTSESERLAQQETVPVDQVERSESLHLNTLLPHIIYSDLDSFTNHFNELSVYHDGGRKLGTGAFGSVYLGILPSGECVAVKKLHIDAVNVELQFRNEVEALSKFRHANLLGLVGYSCDSPTYCLVYEYMSNGSLQDRLACKQQQTEALKWQTRLDIALGTALGILYLHTAFEKPLIHRDIKSANILLDDQLIPKLGDFGLVRLGQQHGNTVTMTTTVLGTSAYMAPEAFRGDVSIKLDTFSFGVVLLEILTGLPPYDEEREGCDLVTHVEAMCEEDGTIDILLDIEAGDWGKMCDNSEVSNLADNLYSVALSCIEDSRQKRPNMTKVVQRLEEIVQKITS